jgi:hypothetical protein
MKQIFSILLICRLNRILVIHENRQAMIIQQSKNSTMSKKETVGTFLGAVMKEDTETMREFANADYIQHNPFIPTGLEPFIQMLPVLQENGTYC